MPRGGARPGAGRKRKNPGPSPAVAPELPARAYSEHGKKTSEAPPNWPFGTVPPEPEAEPAPDAPTEPSADPAAATISPLEFFLSVMRDPQEPDGRRMQAAALAAPYVHAKPAPAGKKKETAEAAAGLANSRFGRRPAPLKLVNGNG